MIPIFAPYIMLHLKNNSPIKLTTPVDGVNQNINYVHDKVIF